MSTRFTRGGISLVESQTLQLIQKATQLTDISTRHLSNKLIDLGYLSITPSLLSFLSVLECGVNYGSEIARNLGVSRQMVAKTVRELCRLGYLQQVPGVGKQKQILFTENGEYLMSDARRILSEIDGLLFKQLEEPLMDKVVNDLGLITNVLAASMET